MRVSRFFIIPWLAVAATAVYIVVGPSPASVGGTSETATADIGSMPSATPTAQAVVPDGATGRLSYRSGPDYVTVQFPEAVEVDRARASRDKTDAESADGLWRSHSTFTPSPDGGQTYSFSLYSSDGRTFVPPSGEQFAWSPAGHLYAVKVFGDGYQEIVVGDPDTDRSRVLAHEAGILAIAWNGDGTAVVASVATLDGPALVSFRLDGSRTRLSRIESSGPYLYRSPSGDRIAFTAAGDDGWRLMVYEAATGAVRDLGPMGSDGPDGQPVVVGPDQKGPLYIAWSPDGTRVAFGGGLEPPYEMKIVDFTDGSVRTATFTSGYPGEIAWSADNAKIAVSTYDLERTQHEVYVVDPATGTARHVAQGCIIVWAPDSRFLAAHSSEEHGVVIVDTETGLWGHLTFSPEDAPVAWQP